MSERTTRVVRGLVAAAIAVFVAAFSHVAAGGGAPGATGLALALAFAAVLCVLLTRRAPSLPLLGASVALSQLGLHLLFEVGTGAGGGSVSGLVVSESAHHGHTVRTLVPDVVAGSAAHGHDQGWMWVSHAIAALVTVIVLRRGELTLRRLVELGRLGLAQGRLAGVRIFAAVRRCRGGLVTLVTLVTGSARDVAGVGAGAAAGASRSSGASTWWPTADPSEFADLGVVFARRRHRGPPPTVRALLPAV